MAELTGHVVIIDALICYETCPKTIRVSLTPIFCIFAEVPVLERERARESPLASPLGFMDNHILLLAG